MAAAAHPGPLTHRPVRPGECVVWWADPSAVPAGRLELLDAGERERYAELRRPEDRARLLTGAAVLRTVVGRELGIDPVDVHVRRDCPDCPRPHGKPTLPGTGLECTVAHAGDRVAVALSAGPAIGVDVEPVPPPGRLDAALVRVLAPAESARLAGLKPAARTTALVELWTAKEAVVKATGAGLRTDLRTVLVDQSGDGRPTASTGDGRTAALVRLHPGAGYEARLAVLGPPPERVREQDGAALLR